MNLRSTLRPHARLAGAVVGCALVLGLLEGSSLWLIIPVLQQLQSDDPAAIRQVQVLVAGIGLLVLARAGAGYVYQTLATRLRLRVLIQLRETLVAGLHQTRADDLDALGRGRIVNLVSTQTERLVDAAAALTSLARAAVLLAVYAAALLALSPPMIGAVATVAASVLVANILINRRVRRHATAFLDAEADWGRLLLDEVEGWRQVRTFGIQGERFRMHRAAHQRLGGAAATLQRWRDAFGPVREILVTGALVAGILIALAVNPAAFAGNLPSLVFVGIALLRIHAQLAVAGDAWSTIAEQEPAASAVFALARPQAGSSPAGLEVGESIALEGVQFGYPGGPAVLRGLALRLERGELLALVGSTGAGKSTLAQLLVRLRDPHAGRLLVDGRPVDAAAGPGSSIAIVFQDDFIFDESLLWNVTLGRPAERVRVAQVLAAVGLDGDQPDPGRRLGNRGSALSGGQRQRVALARALLLDPAVLILDEATSALDGQSERELLGRLREARAGRITLIISHRLSAVSGADRILVLENGVIEAEGAHEQLLETNACYRRLFESQLASSPV